MPEELPAYKTWFDRDPGGYKQERALLEARGFILDEEVFKKERRVQFRGRSQVQPERELILSFPDTFPSDAPQMADTGTCKPLLRHHNPLNRHICLFGFDEHRWDATKSAVAAIDEAEQVIGDYNGSKPLPQDESAPEPITSLLPYLEGSSILVPPPISKFVKFAEIKQESGKFTLKWKGDEKVKKGTIGRGIVIDAQFGPEKVLSEPFFNDAFQGPLIHGQWFYVSGQPGHEELKAQLDKSLATCKLTDRSGDYWIALIFNEQSGSTQQTRQAWVVFRLIDKKNGPKLRQVLRTYMYVQEERQTRIPGLEGLPAKTVTLIGCGSIGSKIAVNLAASGIHKFHLIDCDSYEPNNSVRHELGISHFGKPKTDGLIQRLCSMNPAVYKSSKAMVYRVGGTGPSQGEDMQNFIGLVQNSDVVIDATGKHSITHFLNDICSEIRKSLISVSITNGAWGGEVVRMVPGATACWLCWRHQYFEDGPPAGPRAETRVFAPGCDQPTFTGTTYELGIVANLGTSMVVDTLLQKQEFSGDYIRYSNRDNDGRLLFKTEVLTVTKREACPFCA